MRVLTAVETVSRLLVAHIVGRHALEEARQILDKVVNALDSEVAPLFVTDELAHYATVLEEKFSHEETVPLTDKRSRPANPKLVVDPELHYATVKKTRKQGRIVKIERNVVFGTMEGVKARLENSPSKSINMSYIERINRNLRQWDSHLSRKTMAFAKDFSFLEAKVALNIFSYNFAKTHRTLTK
jgi:IS1 family transposase